ncbi:MAG: hypothetical protein RIG27_32725 [Coleofasciculus sp. F4-SAH-05]
MAIESGKMYHCSPSFLTPPQHLFQQLEVGQGLSKATATGNVVKRL